MTNDDGVTSPGLHALAAAAGDLDAEVMVVAPSSDQSGTGAAIRPLHSSGTVAFESVTLPGLEAVLAYRVDCPPALAVLSAVLGSQELRPDLVLSGINIGLNLGVAVLHSGTVGAALTATNLGLPAVAVSIDAGRRPHWATAAAIAEAAARWLSATRLPVVLNINVPDVGVEDLAGVRSATLSRFRGARAESGTPDDILDLEPDSDAFLVRHGFATITVLHGLREAGHETGSDAASFVEDVVSGQRWQSTGLASLRT
ncbi:MAG: 5'/3'-nucleotidase SurE [Acidimicrobiales bacterium]